MTIVFKTILPSFSCVIYSSLSPYNDVSENISGIS